MLAMMPDLEHVLRVYGDVVSARDCWWKLRGHVKAAEPSWQEMASVGVIHFITPAKAGAYRAIDPGLPHGSKSVG
jgi:hypothetical protein